MKFQEDFKVTEGLRQAYLDGFEAVIEKRQEELGAVRRSRMNDILADPAPHRKALMDMLGWPLTEERTGIPRVTEELLTQEGELTVYRLRVEVLEGLWMAGLLFKQNQKAPMVLCQHGGLGTPELIAGFYGSTANYNNMVERVLAQGCHVFAPQLLLWNKDYGIPINREEMDFRLKRLGSSVAAMELYGLMRCLDYLETLECCGKLGMVGLSYGGFYTQYLSALDTRIQSAVACSYFCDRDASPRADWTWLNSAALYEDAEIACMVYPRRICLQMGNRDELFDSEKSRRVFETIPCKGDWIELIVFDGKHEFYRDDAPLIRLAKDLK